MVLNICQFFFQAKWLCLVFLSWHIYSSAVASKELYIVHNSMQVRQTLFIYQNVLMNVYCMCK